MFRVTDMLPELLILSSRKQTHLKYYVLNQFSDWFVFHANKLHKICHVKFKNKSKGAKIKAYRFKEKWFLLTLEPDPDNRNWFWFVLGLLPTADLKYKKVTLYFRSNIIQIGLITHNNQSLSGYHKTELQEYIYLNFEEKK